MPYEDDIPLPGSPPKAKPTPVSDFLGDNKVTVPIKYQEPEKFEYPFSQDQYQKGTGYQPTYFEHPQRVARYHQTLQALPPGTEPPPWLHKEEIDLAYEYLKKANNGAPWWQWKYLNADDPARQMLQGIPEPPEDAKWPNEEWWRSGSPQRPQAEVYEWMRGRGTQPYTPAEPETLAQPGKGGMTDAEFDRLLPWQKALVWLGGQGQAVQGGAMGGAIGLGSALPGAAVGLVTGGPVGAIAGGLGSAAAVGTGLGVGMGAASQGSPGLANLMMKLDYPTEYFERALGVMMLAAHRVGEETRERGFYGGADAAAEILNNLPAAWDAAHLTYESGLSLTSPLQLAKRLIYPDAPLAAWGIDSPQPYMLPGERAGVDALYDMFERISQGTARPEDVWNEYSNLYGLSGQYRELLGHIVLDPLNILGVLGVGAGLVSAGVTGNKALRMAALGSSGPVDMLRQYGAILRSTEDDIAKLGPLSRWLGGVTKTGQPTDLVQKGGKGPFNYLLSLTPQARATEVVNNTATVTGAVLDRARNAAGEFDPAQAAKYLHGIANNTTDTARELSMKALGAPDAAAIPMALKDNVDKIDNIAAAWEASQPRLNVLNKLGEMTGKSIEEVVIELADEAGAKRILVQIQELAARSDAPEAKELLLALQGPRPGLEGLEKLDANTLVDLGKPFQGKDGLPMRPEMVKASMQQVVEDVTAQWAVDWFGVKPDPGWVRMANVVKSAQSLVLLGFNPTYFLNNTINNLVTVASEGLLGVRSPDMIRAIWARAGIQAPRLRAGVGVDAGGLEQAHRIVREASSVDSGAMETARRGLEKTRRWQVFGRLSGANERASSEQAVTSGFVQFMSRHWRKDVGFSPMPPMLEQRLAAIDPSLPKAIYSIIEGGWNQAEIEKKIWQGLARRSVLDGTPEIARRTGIPEADVAEVLNTIGAASPEVAEQLAKAADDTEINQILGDIERKAQDHLDDLNAANLEMEAAKAAARVDGEGAQAALELFDQMSYDYSEHWYNHFVHMDLAAQQAEMMDGPARSLVWENAFSDARRSWDRLNKRQEAQMAGIAKGLGLDSDAGRRSVANLAEQHATWTDFYRFRDEQYGAFRNGAQTWDEVSEKILAAWEEAYTKQETIFDRMDAEYVQLFTDQFGAQAGEVARAWRQGIKDIRIKMHTDMADYRARGTDSWRQFLRGPYFDGIKALFEHNIEGARAMWRTATGGKEPPPGAAAPSQPEFTDMDWKLGGSNLAEGRAAQQPGAPGTEATVPVMITQAMRQQLSQLGYSNDQVRGLTPQAAWDAIAAGENMSVKRAAVRKVAAEIYPSALATATEEGQQRNVDPYILNVINKHGGQEYADLGDVDVDVAIKAITEYRDQQLAKAAQAEEVRKAQQTMDMETAMRAAEEEPVAIPEAEPETQMRMLGDIPEEERQAFQAAQEELAKRTEEAFSDLEKVEPIETKVRRLYDEGEINEAFGIALDAKKTEVRKILAEVPELTERVNRARRLQDNALSGNLEAVPDDIRLQITEVLGAMRGELEDAENGMKIFEGGKFIGSTESSYPKWYNDAAGAYKGMPKNKHAVLQALDDIVAGNIAEGKTPAVISRLMGYAVEVLEKKNNTYRKFLGYDIDITLEVRQYQRRARAEYIQSNLDDLITELAGTEARVYEYYGGAENVPELQMEQISKAYDEVLKRMVELDELENPPKPDPYIEEQVQAMEAGKVAQASWVDDVETVMPKVEAEEPESPVDTGVTPEGIQYEIEGFGTVRPAEQEQAAVPELYRSDSFIVRPINKRDGRTTYGLVRPYDKHKSVFGEYETLEEANFSARWYTEQRGGVADSEARHANAAAWKEYKAAQEAKQAPAIEPIVRSETPYGGQLSAPSPRMLATREFQKQWPKIWERLEKKQFDYPGRRAMTRSRWVETAFDDPDIELVRNTGDKFFPHKWIDHKNNREYGATGAEATYYDFLQANARPAEGPDVLEQPAKFGKPQQMGMFGAGEDLPLMTGTPMKAQESVFKPAEAARQGTLFDMRPQPKGAIEGGEAAGPLFDAAIQVGQIRDNLRRDFISLFLAGQESVLAGVEDAARQADAILALLDAHANVWAKRMGKTPLDWYQTHIAGVKKGGVPEGSMQDPRNLKQRGLLPSDRNLIVTHNLTEPNLLFTDELGGLAMPSLAITKKEHALEHYGDITLLGDQRLVDPTREQVRVVDTDMYSPRYPELQYVLKGPESDAYYTPVGQRFLGKYGDQLPDWQRHSFGESYQFITDAEDQGLRYVENNPAVMLDYLDRNGIEAPETLTDMQRLIREQHLPGFAEYAKQVMQDLTKEKRFFSGWTYSGYKRYKKYTLENVVARMKSEMKEGEGTFYGAGNVRAKGAKRFRSIEGIRKAQGNLVDDMKTVKEEMNNRLSQLAWTNQDKYSGGEDNPFIITDRFVEALTEAARTKNVRAALEGWGFKDVDLAPVYAFLDDLQQSPTEYFEAKMQRAVDLGEFSVAIVPKNTSAKARAVLERKGVRVVEYDPDVPGDRRAVVQRVATESELLFQEQAPVWYSQLERAVESIPQEKMGVDQLRGMIAKGGVKADEIKWSGLDDFLAQKETEWPSKVAASKVAAGDWVGGLTTPEQKGPVKITKAEVLEYIRQNKVEVREVIYPQDAGAMPLERIREIDAQLDAIDVEQRQLLAMEDSQGDMLSQKLREAGLKDEEIEWIDMRWDTGGEDRALQVLGRDVMNEYSYPFRRGEELRAERSILQEERWRYENLAESRGTHYSTTTLPGAEPRTYRELLLTLPVKEEVHIPNLEWRTNRQGMWAWFDDGVQVSGAFPLHENREAARASIRTQARPGYSSPHWQEPNVLAHVRFDDRIDADGKRVLFIEEIQSDWHQAGRKQGYKAKQEEIDKLYDEHWKVYQQLDELVDIQSQPNGAFVLVSRDTGDRLGAMRPDATTIEWFPEATIPDAVMQAGRAYEDATHAWSIAHNGRVPLAPFAKTWDMLTMKRMIRWAAENGYDRIAFPTGPVAARIEGHQLIENVSHIRWDPDNPSVIRFKQRGSDAYTSKVVDPSNKLEDYVGADIAKQLRDKAAWEKKSAHGGKVVVELDTNDVVFGGETMRWFYDRDLVNNTNKYLKKWGARVGETEIGSTPSLDLAVIGEPGNYYIMDMSTGPGRVYAPLAGKVFQTQEEAYKAISPGIPVHSIDVTPEMKASVMQGQPLFQSRSDQAAQIRAKLDEYGMVPASAVARLLGDPSTPEYLQPIIQYMTDQRSKALAGEMKPRDIAKALLMTVASQHAREIKLETVMAKLDAAGIKIGIPEDYVIHKGDVAFVRPEDLMAAWLLSPNGKAALDALDSGALPRENISQLFAKAVEVRKVFGNDQLNTANLFGATKPNQYNLTNLQDAVMDFNEIGRALQDNPDAMAMLNKFAVRLNGVGHGKEGFIKHLFGFGDSPTIDAVAVNTWITGQANRGQMKTAQADLLREIGADPSLLVRSNILPFFREGIPQRFAELRAMGYGADIPEDVFNHIMHHWIWDRAKGTLTDHKAMYDAMRLAQGEGLQAPRGAVSFLNDGRAILHALEAPDVSTLAHEIGHIFRRDLAAEDLAIAEKWAGAADGFWNREAEEKFAKGFEAYLKEGKAPVPELQGIFEQFAQWIAHVYARMKEYFTGSEINDDMRGVYNRLLAENPDAQSYNITTQTGRARQATLFQEGNPSIEFEDGRQVPLENNPPDAIKNPLGAVDSLHTEVPLHRMEEDGYAQHVQPVLDGLRTHLNDPNAALPQEVTDLKSVLDQDTARQLRGYLHGVYGQQSDMKLAGVRVAEARRDAALLNYSRRYGFDNVLMATHPYSFWYTRSMINWALRVLDKPSWLANYYRLRSIGAGMQENEGYPQRLKNKMKIPLPFMPDWAGGGVYVDPLRQMFPFMQMAQPFEKLADQNNMIARRAAFILEDWGEEQEADPQQISQALQTKAGPLWEKAIAQAKVEIDEEVENPLDFINTISGMSLPLNWAYQFMRGKKDRIGPLPTTRMVKGVTAAMGLNQGRGYNMEGPIRRALGMPEYDRFTDYRVDRMLSNMAADGFIDAATATQAMIDRGQAPNPETQKAFIEAERRVAQQGAMGLIGGPFQADIFPEGEQRQRAIKNEYSRAAEAWRAGDEDALSLFFEKYPEYEARLALYKDPAARLKGYLVGEVWDRYMDLPDLHKKQAREQLGQLFEEAFLEKETRSYDSIKPETLALWAQRLGSDALLSIQEAPQGELDLEAPEIAAAYQELQDERDRRWPDIGSKLNLLYKLPPSMQDQYRQAHPELEEYETWRTGYLADHPEVIQYAIGEDNKVQGAKPEIQALYYQYLAGRDRQFPGVMDVQNAYYDNNKPKGFLKANPMLPAYWDWRREFMKQYPEMIPYIMSTESLTKAVLGDEAAPSGSNYTPYEIDSVTLTPQELTEYSPALVRQLIAYFYNGDDLGAGARKELRRIWVKSGRKLTFDEYLTGPVQMSVVNR